MGGYVKTMGGGEGVGTWIGMYNEKKIVCFKKINKKIHKTYMKSRIWLCMHLKPQLCRRQREEDCRVLLATSLDLD